MNNAEVYDPRSGKSQATSPLNESRFKLPDEAAQLASGQVLISGGSTKVEIYDPESRKFLVASGEMNDAWHLHVRNPPQRWQRAAGGRVSE
jgi:hypothetical protein